MLNLNLSSAELSETCIYETSIPVIRFDIKYLFNNYNPVERALEMTNILLKIQTPILA